MYMSGRICISTYFTGLDMYDCAWIIRDYISTDMLSVLIGWRWPILFVVYSFSFVTWVSH